MPTSAYTLELWALFNATGPYPIIGPSPPAGFIWVVRDVVFQFPLGSGYWPIEGHATLSIGGFPIAGTPIGRSFANRVFRYGDLRQTVGQDDIMEFTAASDGWNMRVAGYQLTAT